MTSNPKRARISIDFTSFWTSGFGGGRGRHLDASCLRDAAGFPAMPLTQIKGTIRESAERLAKAGDGGWTQPLVDELLGPRTEDGLDYGFAALAFNGEAKMSPADKELLANDPANLYRRIAATKVNDQGVAQDQTLRFIEAAVPVSIHGVIEWQSSKEPRLDWIKLIDIAAANTLAFGKGKNDGYGRAIAQVIAFEASNPTPDALDPNLLNATEVRLVLRQKRPAIFSEYAATEGAHRTLRAPTGAALLGWCAANGSYGDFGDAAYDVFHSGAVCFGNAAPVAGEGEVLVPFPRNLFAPKNSKPIASDGTMNPALIQIGPPPQDAENDVQFEAQKRDHYRISMIAAPKMQTGQRLRTATRAQRAARSQLFGYQHIDDSTEPYFVAPLARSANIDAATWKRILETFHGQTLRLGRAKGTGYGGEYECQVIGFNPTLTYKSAPIKDRIVVFALSDIALVDRFGQPVATPTAGHLGLSGDWVPDRRNSAISLRRYAPWNGNLRSRDVEHQVIEAGSVIIFNLPEGGNAGSNAAGLADVGIWREAGCGRIWKNPAFLMGKRLAACDAAESAAFPTATPQNDAGNHWPATASLDLAAWLSAENPNQAHPNAANPAQTHSGNYKDSDVHILRLTVRVLSPVSLGSGDMIDRQIKKKLKGTKKSELVDAPVNALQRDANGLPTIPGASPQGVARHICKELAEGQDQLFGVENADGSGQAGLIVFSWAQVCDSGGNAVAGLRCRDFASDGILALLAGDTPLLRDHVALNACHSVDERRKYARAAVPVGTRFCFELVAIGDEAARGNLIKAARYFRHPRFRLGGRSRRGYGRIEVDAATIQSFAADHGEDLRMIRRQPASTALGGDLMSHPGFKPHASDVTTFTIELSFRDSLRIGGTDAPENAPTGDNSRDNILWALRETRIDPTTGGLLTAFPLNGTAFTGPLAHRMEYYARKAGDRTIDVAVFSKMTQDEKEKAFEAMSARPDCLQELLGVAKKRGTAVKIGQAARLTVEDAVIEGVDVQLDVANSILVDHVAIDRFTSGARDLTGGLFAEECLKRPTATITINLRAPGKAATDGIGGWDKTVAECFLKALHDICTARVPIGARSLGVCTGKISVAGADHEEWLRAVKKAGFSEIPEGS